MFRKFCTVCGVAYQARRSSSKYCSGKCSMLAYRSRRHQREKMERWRLVFDEQAAVDRICLVYEISEASLLRTLRRLPRETWTDTLSDIAYYVDKASDFWRDHGGLADDPE